MYNDDYIIAVDENGQPYIAHANWGELSGRAVKYIKKFIGPNGKMRYVYDTAVRKAKTAAKKAWGSKAGRWIDEHDAGLSEELMRARLHRKAKKAFKNNDSASARRYAHRAAELRDEARSERQNTRAAKAYRSAKDKVKDKLGYDEREAMEKARAAYEHGGYNERTRVGNEHRYKETLAAYANTPLGRYEEWNSKRKAKKWSRQQGKNK